MLLVLVIVIVTLWMKRAPLDPLERENSDQCLQCLGDGLAPANYYMVHDALWEVATLPHERDCVLCWACLEQRLGRCLTEQDLTLAPVNLFPHFLMKIRHMPRETCRLSTTCRLLLARLLDHYQIDRRVQEVRHIDQDALQLLEDSVRMCEWLITSTSCDTCSA